MKNDVYGTMERIFALLVLLNNAPSKGYSREEIFDQVPGYVDPLHPSAMASHRKLERDLKFLEDVGFCLDKSPRRGRIPMHYRVVLAENFF